MGKPKTGCEERWHRVAPLAPGGERRERMRGAKMERQQSGRAERGRLWG